MIILLTKIKKYNDKQIKKLIVYFYLLIADDR